MLERMFDPFVTSKAQGLGLGLSISRTIVSAHGGRLWAENNEDGGATVHCLLAASRRSEASRDGGRVIAILQPADPPSEGEQASGA